MDKLKILVCDPDENKTYDLKEILANSQFRNAEVTDVPDRQKLCGLIKNSKVNLRQYDIILIGYDFKSKEDGDKAIKLIKSMYELIHENSKFLPIIFLDRFADKSISKKADQYVPRRLYKDEIEILLIAAITNVINKMKPLGS